MNWLQRVFGPSGSSATAKERLRLVLLTDHLSLAPDVVEALKRDLLAVISRYVEVDESHADVSFERQDSAIAMLANVPILKLRERPLPPDGGRGGRRAEAPAGPPPNEMTPPFAPAAIGMPAPSAHAAVEATGVDVVPETDAAPEPAAPIAPRRRRRRRRNAAASSGGSTASAEDGAGGDPAHATG